MNQIWELKPQYQDNRPIFQPCQVMITWADSNMRQGQYGYQFQNVSVVGQGGVPIRASIVHKQGSSTCPFPADKLNIPLDCEVKVEPDTSAYAVNGYKYTIRLDKPAATSSAARGPSRPAAKSSIDDIYLRIATMCFAYAKDMCEEKIPCKDIPATAQALAFGVFALADKLRNGNTPPPSTDSVAK